MRWILLLAAIVGFAVAFTTKSPGMLGFGILVGLGGLFGFAVALASARIAANSQPETVLIVDPEVNALRTRANQSRAGRTAPRASATLADQNKPDSARAAE